ASEFPTTGYWDIYAVSAYSCASPVTSYTAQIFVGATLPEPAVTAHPACATSSGWASVDNPEQYTSFYWEVLANASPITYNYSSSVSFTPTGTDPVQLRVTVTNATG